jgi:hypothetical protein
MERRLLSGGQSGEVIKPGNATGNILYQRIAGIGDQARMPMGGKLPPDQVAVICDWINQSASGLTTQPRLRLRSKSSGPLLL